MCGKCCHILEDNQLKKCKYLRLLKDGTSVCLIYEKRLGTHLGGQNFCGQRKNSFFDYPDCPYNTDKEIAPEWRNTMNINDFDKPEEMPSNIWKAIFDKQREIALKYAEIEGMGTLLQEKDNINTAVGQKWIKDFAWRVTEEIAEALEAKRMMEDEHGYLKDDADEIKQHYFEEMIDALHFLTELTIIAGYDETLSMSCIIKDYETKEWEIVYRLGIMCNCLKNKPWKQTQMLTDKQKFEKYLGQAWSYFKENLYNEGLEDEDIYNLYFKKNEVNKFRIRSKY